MAKSRGQHKATKTGKGASGQTVVVSPAWRKRQAKRRRDEEREWRSKNGPVTTRRIGDEADT